MMPRWGQIAAAVAFVGSLGAAYAAYDQIRPWPSRSAFEDVAGVSLKTAINQRYDFLVLERRELRKCEQQGGNCTQIRRRIQRLEQEILELEKKRERYGG